MKKLIQKDGNSGFSLVEMCIVFVIMGLIVGGVLAGTNLKRSIQIKAVMDQEARLNQAMVKFRQLYGAWAGDLWNATDKFGAADGIGNVVTNGDGDDLISGVESMLVMHHLALAGLIEGAYGRNGWQEQNLIYGPIDKKSIFVIESEDPEPLSIRFIGILDEDDSGTVDWNGGMGFDRGVFTPKEMQAIDTKYDDALPDTGNVHGHNGIEAANLCVVAGVYLTTDTARTCYLGVIVQTMF